jgi:hypothetical protein
VGIYHQFTFLIRLTDYPHRLYIGKRGEEKESGVERYRMKEEEEDLLSSSLCERMKKMRWVAYL